MKFNIENCVLEKCQTDCIVIFSFQDFFLSKIIKKIDLISKGYITNLLKFDILPKKIGQVIILYQIPKILCPRILIVGCSKKEEIDEYKYKKIIKKTIKVLLQNKIKRAIIFLDEINIKKINNYWKIRKTIEQINEELYVFKKLKSEKKNKSYKLKKIVFNMNLQYDSKIENKAIVDAIAISKSIKITKDLANMPPNICNSFYLSQKVKNLKNNYQKLNINIINEEKMKKLGMHAYLAVGEGSKNESLMLIMQYKNVQHDLNPIVLIGKGLTFDSGGISIKPSYRMNEMKYDMCGAATVYGIFYFLCKLNLPLHVIGILACSENMLSSKSFRPGDIITTMSGKTVEIVNTDAEGRLVLCDVLTYVKRFNPEIVIDIATLTGACSIALGNHYSGLMSNNKNLEDELLQASKESGDKIWKLPLDQEYNKQLKSDFADMVNSGNSYGGAITAACFLKKFSKKYNWAHLDIAGTAWNMDKGGATGRPVSLISQFLLNRSYKKNTTNLL